MPTNMAAEATASSAPQVKSTMLSGWQHETAWAGALVISPRRNSELRRFNDQNFPSVDTG